MDSDKEEYLPASQMIESETVSATDGAQAQPGPPENGQHTKTTKQKKVKEPAPPGKKDPCIYCGKNCTKGCIQCAICALWSHMSCTGLSKEALKGLEVQAKEVGQAYWACRSCMSFNTKWNRQMKEVSRRQEETEAKVADNSDKIEEVRMVTEELRRELREQAKKTEGIQERMELVIDEELRERDARRLNLVIHGLQEPGENVKESRARMEEDKTECEKVFIAMKARTRYQDIRFCRRIGEKGEDPRPLVIGVFSEEVKRHLLEKARELLHTHYENVTVVPDMTKSQRRGEQRLRQEADQKNAHLTEEDKSKHLKWLVVGKRGEKRLIKGVDREAQPGRQERARGPEAASNGWNPQIRVNTGPNRGQFHHWGNERRTGGQNWRTEHNSNNWNNGFGNRGGFNGQYNNGFNNSSNRDTGFGNRGGGSSSNSNSSSNGFNNNRNNSGRDGFNGSNNSDYNSSNSGNNFGRGGLNGPNNSGYNSSNIDPPNTIVNVSCGTGNMGSSSSGTNGQGYNGNSSNSNGYMGNSGGGNGNGNNIPSGGSCGTNNGGGHGPYNSNNNPNPSGGNDYGTGNGRNSGAIGGLRPTETGARMRDSGVWTQHQENTSNGEMDRQARQLGEWHAVEDRHLGPPALLPRPPIQRETDHQEEENTGRTRLASNKRPRSFDGDMESESQLSSRNRRY